jgi:hypothetical protein
MVVAGAEKGIYGLREMAEETVGGMVRAGESKHLLITRVQES